MSRNGTSPLVELADMEDNDLQVIAMRCFAILAERWGQEISQVVWDCFSDLEEEEAST